MAELVEKDLSYKIVGVLYDVYNSLGGGYQEKYYQRAVAGLKEKGLHFEEQLSIPLTYGKESIGRYFLDFLVEEKVIVELKSAPKIYTRDIKQILSYLNSKNIELGILVNFSKKQIYIKRILKGNIRDNSRG